LSVFNTYDCGTGDDQSRTDIIPEVARSTDRLPWAGRAHQHRPARSPQASKTIDGVSLCRSGDKVLVGGHMHPAVAASLAAVSRVWPASGNLVGWSQGAITSIMRVRRPSCVAVQYLPRPHPELRPARGRSPRLDEAERDVADVVRQLVASDFTFQAPNPLLYSRTRTSIDEGLMT